MLISGYIQEMSAGEIKNSINPEKYKEIKQKDSNPLFKSFVLGHVGVSTGKELNTGYVKKKWYHNVIQKMADKLNLGSKVFWHHKKDSNNHSGREVIGEIVGKLTKVVNGVFSTLGIAYIKPEHRDKKADVASVELNMLWDNKTGIIKTIKNITGIALGNSEDQSPGFAGATLQGAIQEFQDKSKEVNVTLAELRAAIKASDTPIKITDLFSISDIEGLQMVKNNLEASERLFKDRNEWKSKAKGFDKLKEEFEAYKTQSGKDILSLTSKNLKMGSGDKLNELAKTMKIEGKKLDFLKADFQKSFEIKDTEKFDSELKDFAENSLKEFTRVSKLLGIKEDTENEENETPDITDNDKAGGSERNEKGYLKTNPLIG